MIKKKIQIAKCKNDLSEQRIYFVYFAFFILRFALKAIM